MSRYSLSDLRKIVYPRADYLARGTARPPRVSDIILSMTAVLMLVVAVAFALSRLFHG